MKKFHSRKKQAGLTLIEIMIALAIALVIAAVTIGLAANTRKDSRTNEVQTQVLQLGSQLQTIGRGNKYTGVTTKVLVDSGKVPKEWVTGTAAVPVINHAHGGTVAVAASSVNSGTDNAATMTVTNVEQSACTSILTNVQGHFAAIGKAAVGDVKAYGAVPLTPAQVVTACTPASGDSVTLMLTVQ